jgi:hypothetical protein
MSLQGAITTVQELRIAVKALPDSPENNKILRLVERLGRELLNLATERPQPEAAKPEPAKPEDEKKDEEKETDYREAFLG